MGFDHCFFGPNSSLQSGQSDLDCPFGTNSGAKLVFKHLVLNREILIGLNLPKKIHLETHNYPC